jgi:putative transposase
MREMDSTTHFKINYQYREYHFTAKQIQHCAPDKPSKTKVNLFRIHNPDQVVGLILTFYISFAMSARKTAMIMRDVFGYNKVSYQTVLNYAQAVAYYAHQFNLKHKGAINNISVADETYIKIKGLQNYVWFVLSESKHTITAYHISDNRETVSALTALNEAFKTAKDKQKITIITDGLGSYTEAVQFLNKHRKNKIDHIQVIGLQNKDDISAHYRPFKQIIERFNRTYKHHVKPAAGFNTLNGAKTLTTLFVTYYNFLRPHMALAYKTPIHIEQLNDIDTIQAKWVKLISMMIPA